MRNAESSMTAALRRFRRFKELVDPACASPLNVAYPPGHISLRTAAILDLVSYYFWSHLHTSKGKRQELDLKIIHLCY